MNSKDELRILQEIEDMPPKPNIKVMIPIDGTVGVGQELKAYFNKLQIEVKDRITKEKLIELYNQFGIELPKFFDCFDARKQKQDGQ